MKRSRGALLLGAAGAASGSIALLHLVVVGIGGPAYRYFGAGEQLARQAESGSAMPALVTLGLAALFATFAAYALSGAGGVRRLPLLRLGLVAIGAIYLLRGSSSLPQGVALLDSTTVFPVRYFAFSLVSLAVGLLYAAGTALEWASLNGLRTRPADKPSDAAAVEDRGRSDHRSRLGGRSKADDTMAASERRRGPLPVGSWIKMKDAGEGWFPGAPAELAGAVSARFDHLRGSPFYVVRLDEPLGVQESGHATQSGLLLVTNRHVLVQCRWQGASIGLEPTLVHVWRVPDSCSPAETAEALGRPEAWAECVLVECDA